MVECLIINGVARRDCQVLTVYMQVKLCGHATLAASHFLFSNDLVNSDTIEFSTLSGTLTAKRVPVTKLSDSSTPENGNTPSGFLIELDFPVVPIEEYDAAADISTICKSINVSSVDEIHKTTTEDDLFVRIPFHLYIGIYCFCCTEQPLLCNDGMERR